MKEIQNLEKKIKTCGLQGNIDLLATGFVHKEEVQQLLENLQISEIRPKNEEESKNFK